nr:MAG TPA: hypothetical protein [Caudoviricetes sp.]
MWLHAARAFFFSHGATSGQLGPKSSPGVVPRRPPFRSLVNPQHRNGGTQ